MGSTQSGFYDTTDSPGGIEGNRNWMSHLPDDVMVTTLSIPGTHNSCALYGGHMYQCQSWTLMDQYLAGIRFVDIRCRHMYNSLVVYNGRCHQKMNFDDVLETTLNFLNDNPTEFIILRVQKERRSEHATRDFRVSFKACLTVHGRDRFWTSHAPMTLRQARNKIILIDDTNVLGMPTLQDTSIHRFETFKLSYCAKWDRIVRHIRAAIANAEDMNILYVTFAYPYSVAWRINKWMLEYVNNKPGPRNCGVIVMNYPGVDLINAIIELNRGLQWRSNHDLSSSL